MNISPSGNVEKPGCAVVLERISAFTKALNRDGYVLRLYENSGKKAESTFKIPLLDIKHKFSLSAFEVNIFLISGGSVTETDLGEGIQKIEI